MNGKPAAVKHRFISAWEISAKEEAQIVQLWQKVWPDRPAGHYEKTVSDFSNFTPGKLPVGYVTLHLNDKVVAQCRIFPRLIRTSASERTVMALGGVCVDPEMRGQSLGRTLVRHAFSLVDGGPYESSLFQTSFQVEPFYLNLGCRRISNTFVNSKASMNPTPEEKRRSTFWDGVVMIYPGNAYWPDGTVDLLGNGY